MTFPRLHALNDAWRMLPPAAVTLRRISQWLGMPAPKEEAPKVRSVEEAVKEVVTAGLPVVHGRPDDPMLALCGL